MQKIIGLVIIILIVGRIIGLGIYVPKDLCNLFFKNKSPF